MSELTGNTTAGHATLHTNPVPWPEAEFRQLVNAAFKSYHSVLALARSPLANSHLVAPLLVMDDVSPTAEERGQALRLVLQWAADQLAPGPVPYPLGEYRPLDDATWSDPHWWRYNILRHRYLEPLHPDEFIEGGRFTETLIALTGIPSVDTFFDERNRAIREVAQWLRQQSTHGQADDELQRLALEEVCRSLPREPGALELLGIAATFYDVFPRTLLLQMADGENLASAKSALDYLTRHRFLLVGDEDQNLWISPRLRTYIYQRQPQSSLFSRHRRAATYFAQQNEPVKAARHLLRARLWTDAAALILNAAADLIDELQIEELDQLLVEFRSSDLPPEQWREVQILRSDLLSHSGRHADALAACRSALKAASEPENQARVYRRMGKLYEKHNQLHALGYYQQALDRFSPGSPEFRELLKDRAWLYILRQEWQPAEADLTLALQHSPAGRDPLRADIYDALASLYRHQKLYDQAIQQAQQALALREEAGDLLRVAKSCNNLGLIYNDMGEYDHAIAAYEEAITTYEKLENQELIAGALLNIGMAQHFSGDRAAAVQSYRFCLKICQEIELPLVEARAHSNLVEALAELDQIDDAVWHWQAGMAVSVRAGFDDEIGYFRQLQSTYPGLQEAIPAVGTGQESGPLESNAANATVDQELSAEEQTALDIAYEAGRVTPKSLMDATEISKATATRRLADLVERGYLQKHGKGRGTYYAPSIPVGAQHNGHHHPTNSTIHAGVGRTNAEEVIRRLLSQQRDVLARQFSVCGLGLVVPAQERQQVHMYQMLVQFAEPPDVAHFFRLEYALSRLLNIPVDLLPVGSPQFDEAPPEILWIWRDLD